MFSNKMVVSINPYGLAVMNLTLSCSHMVTQEHLDFDLAHSYTGYGKDYLHRVW